MTTFWRQWVGLPWELGADPRDGRAACCFRTVQAVREALGLPWPSDRMAGWYRQASSGAWDNLRQAWDELTEPTQAKEPGTLIRFDNGNSFGVGALLTSDIFVTVRHHGRLIVGPRSACGNLSLYRLK